MATQFTTSPTHAEPPLTVRLDEIRSRSRRLVFLTGACWSVSALIWLCILVGGIDAVLRIDDHGVRVLLSLVAFGVPAVTAFLFAARPLVRRVSDGDLALLLERAFPPLQGKLATAVDFERSPKSHSGPSDLRDSSLRKLQAEILPFRFDAALDRRPLVQAAVCAMAATLVGLLFVVTVPRHTGTAIVRLLWPLGEHSWPQTTRLVLVDEHLNPLAFERFSRHRAVVGDVVELYVADADGDLPDDPQIRFPESIAPPARFESTRISLRDASDRTQDVLAVRVFPGEGVTRFRFVGGDDDRMPWLRVEAALPPEIDELRIDITPPAYTGRGPESIDDGRRNISAIVGSVIQFSGTATVPLARAVLHVRGADPVPVTIDEDGTGFQASWQLIRTGFHGYRFELVDRDGFRNPNPFHAEIEGIADALPIVELEQPSDHLQVAPEAVVPVAVHARDDLGLAAFHVNVKSAASSEEARTWDVFDPMAPTERQTASLQLDVAELGFSVGSQFELWAEAIDAASSDSPRVGRSARRTISIVSAEQKVQELKSELTKSLDAARRVLEQEQGILERLDELGIQLRDSGTLRPTDLDVVRQLERNARLLKEELAGTSDGLLRDAEQRDAAHRDNRLTQTPSFQKNQEFLEALRELAARELPQSDSDFTALRRWSAEFRDAAEPPDSAEPLATARRSQQELTAQLGEIVERMGLWQDQQMLTEEFHELIRRQTDLQEAAQSLADVNLTKTMAELSPQARTDLRRLAMRQRTAAEEVDRLKKRVADASETSARQSLRESESLARAGSQLNEHPLAEQLGEAASLLEKNRVGQAAALQEQALETLRKAVDSLSGNAMPDDAETLERIETLQTSLQELRRQQQELADTMRRDSRDDPATLPTETLADKQQQLHQQAERIADELQRLRLRRPETQIEAARESMRRAAERIAAREQGVAGLQDDAGQRLEQAAAELELERRFRRAQLDAERIAGLIEKVTGLHVRQVAAIAEAERLDTERRRRGNWTRGQLASLRELTNVQGELAAKAEQFRTESESFSVASWSLARTVDHMRDAESRLAERLTDSFTVRQQRHAAKTLEILLASLQPDTDPGNTDSDNADNASDPSEGPGAEQGPPGSDLNAQVRLLREYQQELLEQSRWVAARTKQNEADERDELIEERQRLAERQQELAELILNLGKQPQPNDELNVPGNNP